MQDFVDGVTFVSFPVLGLSMGATEVQVSLLTALFYLPSLVWAPFLGPWLDRASRSATAKVGFVVRATSLASLAVIATNGDLVLGHLFLAAFIYGSGETISDPGMHSLLPDVVKDSSLVRANSALSTGRVVAEMFAGRAAGAAILVIGLPLGLSTLTLLGLVALALMLSIRTTGAVDRQPASVGVYMTSLRDGFRYVWTDPLLSKMAPLVAIWAGIGGAFWAIAPVWALDRLALQSWEYSLMLAISACGSLLGASAAPLAVRKLGWFRTAVLAVYVSAIVLVLLALASTLWLAALLLAANAVALMLWNVLSSSLRQSKIPRELLGWAAVAYRVLSTVSLPLGALLGGAIAQRFSVGNVFLGAAALLAVSGAILLPQLRRSGAIPDF